MGTISPKRVLIPLSLATGLSLLGDTSLYTVLPTHLADAGVALGTVGILLSANRFIRVLLNGPVGLLTDRWSRRSVFIPAIFIGALSTGIYAMTVGFWPLLVGRLLWGLSWAGIWISGNAIVLDVSSNEDRGRLVGYYQLAFFMGAASGSIFGGIWTDLLGYHAAMGLAAVITLASGIVALIFLPETKQQKAISDLGAVERPKSKPIVDRGQVSSATALLGVNRLVIAGILLATFAVYLAQNFGETVQIAGLSFGITTITGIALGISTLIGMTSSPIAGFLSDRLQSRWRVAAGGLTSGIVGFVFIALAQPLSVICGLPLVSVSSGSNQGISTALIGDLSPVAERGRRLGVFYTVGDLASAIGPPLAYGLLPIVGLSALYRICAGLLGFMLIIAVRHILHRGRR
jgi:MFS family permease